MPPTLDAIRTAALQLNDDERSELADALYESLDGTPDEELIAGLDRRAQDAREHPELLLTWEQLRELR